MSSETKWTRGPWRLCSGGITLTGVFGKRVNFAIIDGESCDIAYMHREYPNFEANAHLIAAAPELYEALELVQASLEYGMHWVIPDDEIEDRLAMVRKALAKARGEG